MIKKEPEKKSLPEVMGSYKAVFSIPLSEGWANIGFNEKSEMTVELLNEDGYGNGGGEYKLADLDKVTNFMREMKELRLGEYIKIDKHQ